VLKNPLDGGGQIAKQMETISYLNRLRGSTGGTVGVDPASITADHFLSGMRLQPSSQAISGAIGQQVDRGMRFEIDKYSPVVLTLAPCPIVDPENPRTSDLDGGSYFQSPQNRVGAGCHPEPIGETSTCLTAQHVADHSDRLGQSTGLSTILRRNRR
jgi:hypothetical protein